MGISGEEIAIPINNISLMGTLSIPEGSQAIVIFAHGSGSSRFSPRNRYVAGVLQEAGLATLLFDLLTEEEERIDLMTAEFRFDIDLLADRLISITDWIIQNGATRNLILGYFGASTGAAGALIAAANRPEDVYAVVSRGGRPDLAKDALPEVKTPTLFIVGGNDEPVIELNKQAMMHMPAGTEKEIRIIQGASHLFEEPGKLEEVADLARDWFLDHLKSSMPGAA